MNNNPDEGSRELLNSLMSRLSPEDKKRIDLLLSDKEACEKVLQSPEAQSLIRKLGRKKDG
jgi:hypothetical protein